jgi:membrane-associated phospholipid phosphatase
MSRRFLVINMIIAAAFLTLGLLVLDTPLVHAINGSPIENSAIFVNGLYVLDTCLGLHVSYWLAPTVCVIAGVIAFALSRRRRLPRSLAIAILTSGLVQASTIGLMMLGKTAFGRMRPMQLLESGDWSVLWFAGGGSFPSGHGAFYFGLFLPLAASAPRPWQRALLMTIPVFAICARLDMNKHFLSDVSCSALIAACIALLAIPLMRRWLPPIVS